MATTYQEIYSSFLSKITEYTFLNLTQVELEEQLESYLRSSIPRFRKPRVDLNDRDDMFKEFNVELSLFEIEILATLMVVEFLKPQINTSKLIKQTMNDRDFKIHSQSAHLEGLLKLYREMKKDADKLMLDYSFEKFGDKNDS